MRTIQYCVMFHKDSGLLEMVTLGPLSLLSFLVEKQNLVDNGQIQINTYV
jgi:hypothetical protein